MNFLSDYLFQKTMEKGTEWNDQMSKIYDISIKKLCKQYSKLTPEHIDYFLSRESVMEKIQSYLNNFDVETSFSDLKKEFLAEFDENYFSEKEVTEILKSFIQIFNDVIAENPELSNKLILHRVDQIHHMMSGVHDILLNNQYEELNKEYGNNKIKKFTPLLNRTYLEKIPSVENFIGRTNEIEEIINEESNTVILEGMPGIGKTYLAAKIALQESSGCEIFWCTLDEGSTSKSILFKLSKHLNLNTPDFENLLEQNQEHLTNLTNIIVNELEQGNNRLFFDDYHRIRDEKIKVIFEIFKKRCIKTKIIITTHPSPTLLFYDELDSLNKKCAIRVIDGLEDKDANIKLNSLGLCLEEDLLNKIHNITNGHPVALELFANAIKNDFNVYELLNNSPSLPDELIKYLFKKVFSKLDEEEKKILKIISVFQRPIEVEALEKMENRDDLIEITIKLNEKRLISKKGKLYSIHPLIKSLSYSLISNRKDMHKRAAEYFFKKETLLLEEILEISNHLFYAEYYLDSALILIEVRNLLIQEGYVDILLEQLLMYKREKLPTKIWIYIGTTIGNLYSEKKDLQNAEKYFKEMLEISEEVDYINGVSSLLNNLASITTSKGRKEEALGLQIKSLNLYRKQEDIVGKAFVLLNIATTYFELNDLENAYAFASNSLSVIEKKIINNVSSNYNDTFSENYVRSGAINLLGRICDEQNEILQAIEYYKLAKEISLDSGNFTAASIVSGNLGNLYAEIGELNKAENEYFQELEYAKKTKNIFHKQSAYEHIGNSFTDKKDHSEALIYYQKSLEISLKYGMFEEASQTYLYIASDYQNQKKFNLAFENYKNCLKYAKRNNYSLNITRVLFCLATMYEEKGNNRVAIRLCNKIIKEEKCKKTLHIKASAYILIGEICYKQGKLINAERNYKKALNLLEESNGWEIWFDTNLKIINICTSLEKTHEVERKLYEMLNNIQNLKKINQVLDIHDKLIQKGIRLRNIDILYKIFISKISIQMEILDKEGAAFSCNQLSAILRDTPKELRSLKFSKIAVRLSEEMKNNSLLCISYNTLANNYLIFRQYENSKEFYIKSIILRSSIGYEKEILISYRNIKNLYEITGNQEMAETIHEVYENYCSIHNISFDDLKESNSFLNEYKRRRKFSL